MKFEIRLHQLIESISADIRTVGHYIARRKQDKRYNANLLKCDQSDVPHTSLVAVSVATLYSCMRDSSSLEVTQSVALWPLRLVGVKS